MIKMERNSCLYKFRRKIQVLAHNIFSDEAMSKFYYKIVLGKNLHLDNPQTFNEKIQWMKLYYYPNNEKVIQCTDKYEVRKYIQKKGYGNLLTSLIGSWDKSEDINWDMLPQSFVLKCNHGCAYNIVCESLGDLDITNTKKILNKWLKEDFGAYNIELHYSRIKHRRIICEEFLGKELTDYKFFCFSGKAKYIYISKDLIHDRQAQIGFFYTDGTKMPLTRDDYKSIDFIELPSYYDEMLKTANDLAKDFLFVRVDFFVTKERFYFAELTFTPGAGMMPFNPEKFDLEWGKMIDIKNLIMKVIENER